MHARLPPVSLIVCSRNRSALLSDLIASVLKGRDVPTEMVIIDQSDLPIRSLEGLPPVRGCEIRYLWTSQKGTSRARNAGAAAARHDLLVFADDDMLATESWFGALVGAVVQAGPRCVVTGRVPATAAEGHGKFAPSTKTDPVREVYRGCIDQDVLYSNNMAMHRSLFLATGGFDERLGPGTRFPAAEDNDFSFRVLDAGYEIVYAPEAIMYHRSWRPRRGYLPLRLGYGRGQGGFYAKHIATRSSPAGVRLRRDIRDYLMRCVCRMPREPLQACGDLAYAVGIATGAAEWYLRRPSEIKS